MPSGEKPRGQWKSTNQNRDSSALVNGPDFIRSQGSSRCSGFQPGYHSRNWSTGTISAMVLTPTQLVCSLPVPTRVRAAMLVQAVPITVVRQRVDNFAGVTESNLLESALDAARAGGGRLMGGVGPAAAGAPK